MPVSPLTQGNRQECVSSYQSLDPPRHGDLDGNDSESSHGFDARATCSEPRPSNLACVPTDTTGYARDLMQAMVSLIGGETLDNFNSAYNSDVLEDEFSLSKRVAVSSSVVDDHTSVSVLLS